MSEEANGGWSNRKLYNLYSENRMDGPCEACGGSKIHAGNKTPCLVCQGTGRVRRPPEHGLLDN